MSDLREQIARKLAATKMGLVKDVNGERLPDDLWQQCLPQADAILSIDPIAAARREGERGGYNRAATVVRVWADNSLSADTQDCLRRAATDLERARDTAIRALLPADGGERG